MGTGDTMRYYWTKDLVGYSIQNKTLLSTEVNLVTKRKTTQQIKKKQAFSFQLLPQSTIIVYQGCQQDTFIQHIISGN